MGMFAETAIVVYRLLFANQGKQTSVSVSSKQTEVCRFRSEQTNGSCRFTIYIDTENGLNGQKGLAHQWVY
jgi:hypothetical protein